VAVGDHDAAAGAQRDLGHRVTEPARADQPDTPDVHWLHDVPF
jgi:hypothetical protein